LKVENLLEPMAIKALISGINNYSYANVFMHLLTKVFSMWSMLKESYSYKRSKRVAHVYGVLVNDGSRTCSLVKLNYTCSLSWLSYTPFLPNLIFFYLIWIIFLQFGPYNQFPLKLLVSKLHIVILQIPNDKF
jgi:hypothetical protein